MRVRPYIKRPPPNPVFLHMRQNIHTSQEEDDKGFQGRPPFSPVCLEEENLPHQNPSSERRVQLLFCNSEDGGRPSWSQFPVRAVDAALALGSPAPQPHLSTEIQSPPPKPHLSAVEDDLKLLTLIVYKLREHWRASPAETL